MTLPIPAGERSTGAADRVPELDHYEDTGCRMHPSCLQCPLPRCVYELPAARPKRMAARDREIAQLYYAGHSADAIAAHFGLHPRSVLRGLERFRATGVRS